MAFFIGLSIAIPSLLPLAVGVGLLFWLIRYAASGRLSVRTPLDWSVALLLLTIPVTLYITVRSDITRLQSLRLLTGIILLYAIANWARHLRDLRLLVLGASLVGLGLSILAPLSVQWATYKLPIISTDLYDRTAQLFADAVHPNVLAGALVLLLPLPLAWLLFNWGTNRWLERIFLGLSILAILGVIVLTQSRGAWLATVAVLLGLLILRWRWGWIGIFTIPVLIISSGYYLGFNRILDLLSSNPTIGDWNGRVEIWFRAIYMIQDFPYTGIGMGLFQDVTSALYPFSESLPATIPHAHNLFLQVGVDLGIPGLAAWLSILILIIVISWQIYLAGRQDRKDYFRALGSGLLLSQLALVVHGLTDAVTWGMVRPAPLVWAIWGIAAAARLLTLRQAQTN